MANHEDALKKECDALLNKLYDQLPEEAKDREVYKNVARLNRKMKDFLDHLADPSKFKFNSNLEKFLKLQIAEVNTESSEAPNNNEEEISDKMISLAVNLRKMKKLHREIIEKSIELKVNSESASSGEDIDVSGMLTQVNEALKKVKEPLPESKQ